MKIYMIAMKGHPISDMYMRKVQSSWDKLDTEFQVYDAITPKDLTLKNKLTFGKKGKREFTASEKAVWYSHFELWCKSLSSQESIIIIEHDALLEKPLPDLKNVQSKILSYIDRDFGKKGLDISPGSGYYITPKVAQALVANAVVKTITINSDGHLAKYLNLNREKELNDFYYIKQINIDGLNTIDHHNPNRHFIGLDYENFDLPSLYRT